ncbi:hypothetical protein FOA43_002785 [Brettanomyces nanus]|uniref:E3 ubiquitin-protein ligase PEP5 n=1 Tax=Eeniella nana TaxID=13502 RepID=A0A875S110_EENNA|nr:uncharacterized protein FOA43_002785 [Brettanomyces nanus]QPG75431.1 hypothetical protein FOA43_002785 [Brettanomyces nanus]
MSLSSWRKFPFFDCVPIQDPNYGSKEGKALYSDSSVSAICSTPKYLVLASKDALIKFADSSFQLVNSFTAYDPLWTITKMCYIDAGSSNAQMLCSIAETQGQPLTLKLWNINTLLNSDKTKPIDYNSDYLTLCKVTNGVNNYPMTCFASSADFSVLAFGFANGTVILVRGDLLHDRGSRQRIVYESEEPVTGVHFRDDTLLYVTTISKIITVPTSGRNKGKPEKVLEEQQGADINCSDLLIKGGFKTLVVARQESLQFYNSRGRTNNFLLEVSKKRLHAFGDRYLLLVTSTDALFDGSSTFSTYSMMVVDTVGKFLAFSRTIASTAIEVFSLWNDLYVFTSDGVLYRLHEKPILEKLDILVQRDLFPTALKLAGEGEIDDTVVMKIQQQYGDYLYARDEYAEAMEHYVQCVNLGKTSEVIQKYKESSKIPYLTKYLCKLIDLGKSTSDHVTLLFSSYCKLKQDDMIRSFVENTDVNEDFEVINPHRSFDMMAVINLCRQSKYYQLAAFIAKKFNLPSVVVDIQLNDLKSPKNTMKYIKGLAIDDLLRVLLSNVKSLLDKLPNDTTQLLIEVFTGLYKPDPSFDIDQVSIYSAGNSSSKSSESPILNSYRQFVAFMNSGSKEDGSNSTLLSQDKPPTYLPPRPKIIFQHFVNHPNELVIFLEACIESYEKFGGNEKDKKDIMTALYEMYLTLALDSQSPDEKDQWESKAKGLLKTIQNENGWTLEEKTGLLLLSSVSEFNEGEILIREAADESSEGFGLDLFRSAVMSEHYNQSYNIIERFGEKEPDLYRLGLSIYTSDEVVYKTIGEERIITLIKKLESAKLMTPLELIKQLSLNSNGFVKLGLVKQYLLSYIKRQKLEINNNAKLIEFYKKDSKKIEKDVDNLIHKNQTVNQTKCASCGQPLSFPIVHFKCSHSFHEHCLLTSNGQQQDGVGDSNYIVCPRCSSELDAMTVLKKQQEEVGNNNDLFKASLEGSSDRFKVMMGFLGRGAMQPTSIVYEGSEPTTTD